MKLPDCNRLIEDFSLLEGEDRYRYLIELGRELPSFAASERSPEYRVSGCVSQVWLDGRYLDDGGERRLRLRGDSDSHIVRGLVAVLIAAYGGKRADRVLDFDIRAMFARIGLADHLTPQRSNGFFSMVTRIRKQAQAQIRNENESRSPDAAPR